MGSMSAPSIAPVSPLPRLGPIVASVVMLVASVVLGGATSFAQMFLPDALNSFANSASGWTLLTALLVWLLRGSTLPSAVLGAIGFLGLVAGYTLVSELRGYFYSPVLFGIIGLIVGPFVGIAATWLHRHDWKAATGTALLSGIAVGEGIYGLTFLSGTTSPYYWILIAALGVALFAVILTRRVKASRIRLGATAMTAVTATAFIAAYTALGSFYL
ncbi:DUF6518 family protein [Arthrobacter sp. NamB2]|uniref:DUF6518 family protein n=1 Tax=Arthrobacter sp. NamB2 TaxID=2576035 RepID=UPI00294FF65D|nr:DUF6518 family protein [Arthrobacter sp. NamB2]